MLKSLLLSAGVLYLGGIVHRVGGYVCAATHAAGFRFDKTRSEWVSATFRTDNKYVVRPSTSEDVALIPTEHNIQWVVVKVGDTRPTGYCEDNFGDNGILSCEGIDEFVVNSRTLRFEHRSNLGYAISPGEDGDFTPYMEIGTCSPL
jgi:hypothetical protein